MNTISPCTLVLFGASGNLSRVKLIPALFRLDEAGKLPPQMAIVSVGRMVMTRQRWQDEVLTMLSTKFKHSLDKHVVERFIARQHYHANPPDDLLAFQRLHDMLADTTTFPANIAYFLSVRPSDFAPVVESLASVGLLYENGCWRRVLIEKPFGTNLASAQNLQTRLMHHLHENQIYRIDHYLGKSAVQNIMLTRFTNLAMQALWHGDHIDYVEITNSETLGVGERTTFYDATGALRDMMQSHLLQLLALVAMEQPQDLQPHSIRAEKIKLLKAIHPIPVHHAFRAQYAAGQVLMADGTSEQVPGYLEELQRDGITASVTETYAALKVFIDTPRWQGVPFYLRTAKRMHLANTEIALHFKPATMRLSPRQANNCLVLSIQPHERVQLEVQSKIPGLELATRNIKLEAAQRQASDETIDSYEVLLLDLMLGDNSRYLHIDEVEAQWRLIDPIVQAWVADRGAVYQYPAGSADPEASRLIFETTEQFWRR